MTPQEQLNEFRLNQKKELSPQELLKEFRGSQSSQSSLGMKRAKSFEDLSDSVSAKRDEGFDYETGAGSGLRAKLSFMETAEEKEKLLRRIVGEDGFTKDSEGLLALTEIGQLNQGYETCRKKSRYRR